jgi:cytochrome c-type biogenesis protein CcsB
LAGQAATGIAITAWALLGGGLVERGLAAGHWPLTNPYEFALGFAWTIVAVYLLMEATWHERRAGVCVLPIALLAATYAITRPAAEQMITPLLPALRSAWLHVHVLSALVGYGAFGVAAGLGIARWWPAADEPGRWPPLEEVERAMERAVALGFPWLTLSILAGAIWAQNAWGRYWGWDPKETWALVTWLWYLLILHLRPQPSWCNRRLAGLTIVGLGMVIFTFVGVPWLVRTVRLESLHGF